MQKAAAARTAGNSSQASAWERAATQYNLAAQIAESTRQTGTSSISSGNIVELGRQLQSEGLVISGHTEFGGPPARGKHATNSRHYRDLAIDVNAPGGIVEADDPTWKGKFNDLAVRIQRAGFAVKWNDDSAHRNHIHASIGSPEGSIVRAAYGGIFSDSASGKSEAQKVGMLNPQSLISKLGKTAAAVIPEITTSESMDTGIDLTPDLLSMMESKLEKVLYALENNQDTHEKILKNSM
jgi:hypothetical protein